MGHVTRNRNTAIMCCLILLSGTGVIYVSNVTIWEEKIQAMQLQPAGQGRQMHWRPSADAHNHQSLPHNAYNL